jgi:hypothetical protein
MGIAKKVKKCGMLGVETGIIMLDNGLYLIIIYVKNVRIAKIDYVEDGYEPLYWSIMRENVCMLWRNNN